MLLMEVFVPSGTFDEARRRALGQQLIAGVMRADGAPELSARALALTQVIVHEGVMVGGQPAASDGAPTYVVRVNMPAGHSGDRMRAELVNRITRILGEFEGDPERLFEEPRAWVHMLEVPDGNLGVYGQAQRLQDLMNMVLKPGERVKVTAPPTAPTAGTAIDPICGMSVELDDEAITLERDGQRYAFCSEGCRTLFAQQHAAAGG